jgi:hypothetical protein
MKIFVSYTDWGLFENPLCASTNKLIKNENYTFCLLMNAVCFMVWCIYIIPFVIPFPKMIAARKMLDIDLSLNDFFINHCWKLWIFLWITSNRNQIVFLITVFVTLITLAAATWKAIRINLKLLNDNITHTVMSNWIELRRY